MDTQINSEAQWSENIIIADADYVDSVTFDLIVNFERMIGRRIPAADLARWIDCVALDGGIREGEHQTQVVLIHRKDRKGMENFMPSDYESDLNGKAFKDHLGEFMLSSLPIEEIVDETDFLMEIVQAACEQPNVKRVMIVPNFERDGLYDRMRHVLQQVDDDKRITVFAMQPLSGGNFRQEILGYSLMNALGIKSEEIK
ncbi:hypothetical protein LK429_06300 [Hoylesella buccalis]|uniref:DUF6621 family protein n=1 Tax=Hoylesella buccalis TaxID=28127 RepID=UPI001D07739C|nr:DUF6621 family protein [Hoylesella buccalis]MCB6902729.1 hypothetical protein [Hoylesella buccalis]UEA64137.1 hypothetical protein LK429_06300 [Hoylesella buccalis]UWP48567.1 hypothetical protein NQ518_08330 [Hoylesella buccalis ATCC 35310]